MCNLLTNKGKKSELQFNLYSQKLDTCLSMWKALVLSLLSLALLTACVRTPKIPPPLSQETSTPITSTPTSTMASPTSTLSSPTPTTPSPTSTTPSSTPTTSPSPSGCFQGRQYGSKAYPPIFLARMIVLII